MNTVQLTIPDVNEETQELLIATLSEEGFDGFEQTADTLLAFIAEEKFDNDAVSEMLEGQSWTKDVLPEQNWNAVWESNFQPVIIDGFCTIRADFHAVQEKNPYEIIITPKMSFGTGHHATTRLVMTAMKELDFAGKKVLDFGSGTGILAILAEMLGAAEVLGIDNDEWAIENGLENIARNQCAKTNIKAIEADKLPGDNYDILLANINRNILLEFMPQMRQCLKPGGVVIMSGLLTTDRDVITEAAIKQGLTEIRYAELGNWITISFTR